MEYNYLLNNPVVHVLPLTHKTILFLPPIFLCPEQVESPVIYVI